LQALIMSVCVVVVVVVCVDVVVRLLVRSKTAELVMVTVSPILQPGVSCSWDGLGVSAHNAVLGMAKSQFY